MLYLCVRCLKRRKTKVYIGFNFEFRLYIIFEKTCLQSERTYQSILNVILTNLTMGCCVGCCCWGLSGVWFGGERDGGGGGGFVAGATNTWRTVCVGCTAGSWLFTAASSSTAPNRLLIPAAGSELNCFRKELHFSIKKISYFWIKLLVVVVSFCYHIYTGVNVQFGSSSKTMEGESDRN